MILRPLEPAPPASREFLPAWNVVERIQRQTYDACWMITQPSHAALSGDFAARMTGGQVSESGVTRLQAPKLDAALVRAIALHDAGWGAPDSQAIMQSRSMNQGYPGSQGCPKSFVACSVREFLAAWEKSIEVAESACPAGGYIVSRHFVRIAEHGAAHIAEGDRHQVARFLEREAARQKQLAAKQNRGAEELELLTDVLQFCDLLSLYVCSGARESVEFPEYFGIKARLTVATDGYRLQPELIAPGAEFKVAALRHPATKDVSGQEIEVTIW